MRRHIILPVDPVALEQEQLRLAQESISMEEEQLMIEEAQAEATAADSTLKDAERLLEVSDALEDLAVVADGIEAATPAETQLIEIAGDMAVAGSDVSPEEIVPAMESFRGMKIDTTKLRDTAQRIWDSIRQALKQIYERVEAFFYKIFGTIPRLRKKLEELQELVESKTGLKADDKITLTTGVNQLSVAYMAPKSEADIAKVLDVEMVAVKYVFGNYVESVSKRGEVIAKAIADFDATKAAEATTALRAALRAVKPDAIPGAGSVDLGRNPGFATTMGTPLGGNMSLACKFYQDNKTDTSDLGALDRYRNSRCELVTTSADAKPAVHEAEITPISVNAAKGMIKDALAMLDILEDYNRGSKSKLIAKTQKTIEQASEKAAKAMGEADKGDEGAKASVPHYRALLNFNASYARWAHTPAVPMVSHSLNTIKAVMVAIQKSMAAHKAA